MISLFKVEGVSNKPLWTSPTYRELNYSANDYYTGFASRAFGKDEEVSEVEQQVLSFSRVRLMESIYVSISADSYNSVTNSDGEAQEYYSKKIVSKSTLETAGLSTEVYLDSRKNIAYAFSTIRKGELRQNYQRAFELNYAKAEQQVSQMSTMSLSRLMVLRDELTQLQRQGTTLKFLGISEKVVGKEVDDLIGEVESSILEKSQARTGLDEALVILKSILFSNLSPEVKSLRTHLLTYKDSELSSELSIILNHKMSQVLIDQIEIEERSNYVLSGSYWPDEEGVRIMVDVNEFLGDENLRLVGTASATVDENSIKALNVNIEPKVPEVPLLSSTEERPDYGGLMAEVTTQKGKEALAFWEGEELKLAVKVSRPSYVQLINVWADGSKYLLLDNYYLGPDEVNREYWLPFSWETACPCGMENLYLRASNRPFPPVQVADVDGFLKLETDIEVILEITRGFKPKKDDDYLAETSLGLMTFPK